MICGVNFYGSDTTYTAAVCVNPTDRVIVHVKTGAFFQLEFTNELQILNVEFDFLDSVLSCKFKFEI